MYKRIKLFILIISMLIYNFDYQQFVNLHIRVEDLPFFRQGELKKEMKILQSEKRKQQKNKIILPMQVFCLPLRRWI